MKTNRILVLYFILCGTAGFAHEVIVHRAITLNAAESVYENSSAFEGFIDVIGSDRSLQQDTNEMVIGSGEEDDGPEDVLNGGGGYRSLNHFYDPLDNIYGKGLSDSIGFEHFSFTGDKRQIAGRNSFTWASASNCVGYDFNGTFGLGKNYNTRNIWSWQNGRSYQWLGLTASSQLTLPGHSTMHVQVGIGISGWVWASSCGAGRGNVYSSGPLTIRPLTPQP